MNKTVILTREKLETLKNSGRHTVEVENDGLMCMTQDSDGVTRVEIVVEYDDNGYIKIPKIEKIEKEMEAAEKQTERFAKDKERKQEALNIFNSL